MVKRALCLYPEYTNPEQYSPDYIDFPDTTIPTMNSHPEGCIPGPGPRGLGIIHRKAKWGKPGNWHLGNRQFRIAVFRETCIRDKDSVVKYYRLKSQSNKLKAGQKLIHLLFAFSIKFIS